MSAKEALIDAAKSLLWERGYEGMSPAAVLERSGAGQGSFYHHFKGKRSLAHRALTDICAEMRGEFDEVASSGGDELKSVWRYLTQSRDALKGCRLGRLANERAIAEPEIGTPVGDYFSHVEFELGRMLREASTKGALPPSLAPDELAATLVAVVQGGYVLARVHGDPGRMEHALRGALALLSEVLRSSGDERSPWSPPIPKEK